MIDQNLRCEFLNQIVECFEDFLNERGIEIENVEKAEAVADGEDPECICNLYGTDYGNLTEDVASVLVNWGILER